MNECTCLDITDNAIGEFIVVRASTTNEVFLDQYFLDKFHGYFVQQMVVNLFCIRKQFHDNFGPSCFQQNLNAAETVYDTAHFKSKLPNERD